MQLSKGNQVYVVATCMHFQNAMYAPGTHASTITIWWFLRIHSSTMAISDYAMQYCIASLKFSKVKIFENFCHGLALKIFSL